ncbi:helix-turn-helix domain-containing protein [Nitrospirillum sp. BR 11828]|uniref:AraC-like ligand-binding domain-containing protein n=1 Tax=Nitrospirillum sp. BR 11828 TaxID=3104325 RepID=UPI002ACA38C6|nr:helix-turn-helix domain-containing protein [Nitrospirillum sp. BR 11828]MDZ5649837.1 helix-turn-helix domain-containing protein [Nitrospirillum sp. BR 11828]
MGLMERFSVDGVAPARRRHHWNDIVNQAFPNVAVDPGDENFSAHLVRQPLGQLDFAYVHSGPATVCRLPQGRPQQPEEPYFKIHAQHRGSSLNRQAGREAVLSEGDWTLCDSRSPYSITFAETNQMLVVKLPQSLLTRRVPDPDRLVGMRMGAERPESRMLLSMLRSLAPQADLPGEPGWTGAVADILLDVLALAYRSDTIASPGGNGPVGNGWGAPADISPAHGALSHWTRQVRGYVDANLRDPGLNSTQVAAALGISPRYVQMAFASLGTTATAYILARRLDLAATTLRSRRDAPGTSISDIAYDVGFNDLSHFSRSFRAHFGISPRSYRASH